MNQERRFLVVEFIGASGVGKSTLIPAVMAFLVEHGLRVREAEQLILTSYGLPLVRQGKLRVAFAHLLSMIPFVTYLFTKAGFQLCRLGLRVIVRDAGGVRVGFSLARNFLKRIGFHFWVQRQRARLTNIDVIVCDEGVVHAAHNLFVHAQTPSSAKEIVQFASIVPKPDLLVWVTAPTERAIAVHLQRGHSRIAPTPESARAFAERAHETFEILAALPGIKEKLARVDNEAPDGSRPAPDAVRAAGEFILEQVQAANASNGATAQPLSTTKSLGAP